MRLLIFGGRRERRKLSGRLMLWRGELIRRLRSKLIARERGGRRRPTSQLPSATRTSMLPPSLFAPMEMRFTVVALPPSRHPLSRPLAPLVPPSSTLLLTLPPTTTLHLPTHQANPLLNYRRSLLTKGTASSVSPPSPTPSRPKSPNHISYLKSPPLRAPPSPPFPIPSPATRNCTPPPSGANTLAPPSTPSRHRTNSFRAFGARQAFRLSLLTLDRQGLARFGRASQRQR